MAKPVPPDYAEANRLATQAESLAAAACAQGSATAHPDVRNDTMQLTAAVTLGMHAVTLALLALRAEYRAAHPAS